MKSRRTRSTTAKPAGAGNGGPAVRATTSPRIVVPTRAVVLSVACGVAWHLLVGLMLGKRSLDLLTWQLIPGAVAGLVAGRHTIRWRSRRAGRETLLGVLICYYLAAATYILAGAPFVVVLESPPSEWLWRLVTSFLVLYYVAGVATVWGVLLVPLCYLTREFVWRVGVPPAVAAASEPGDRSPDGGEGRAQTDA